MINVLLLDLVHMGLENYEERLLGCLVCIAVLFFLLWTPKLKIALATTVHTHSLKNRSKIPHSLDYIQIGNNLVLLDQ